MKGKSRTEPKNMEKTGKILKIGIFEERHSAKNNPQISFIQITSSKHER